MKTFLFYDIETTGLNPVFDQILTFACIRTDLDLNEIERKAVTICLRKDIIPSPKAFLTHGLTFEELEKGVCEYDAAKTIHRAVNKPGTITIGYNSLGFDDVFLRFFFYRNLLDPYSHQYSQGCSRMDVLPIAVVYRLFNPSGLKWPHNNGKPSLKLELISRENSFETTGRAHEAMNDVEALIALSRIFIKKKDIWAYSLDFFNKTKDEIRINNIKEEIFIQDRSFRLCLMLSASFGPGQNYIIPVLHLGQSYVYKNQSLWLRLDSEDWPDMAGEQFDVSKTKVIRKKSGDANIILPALGRFWNKLPETSKTRFVENMKNIQQNGQEFFRLIQYHCEFKYPFVPGMDIDAALYQDGFFTAEEKKDIRKFHQAQNHEKFDILDQMKTHRIQKLATRILGRNFKEEIMPPEVQKELDTCLNRLKSLLPEDQIIGYKKDTKYNYKNAIDELCEVEESLSDPSERQKTMMVRLRQYLKKL